MARRLKVVDQHRQTKDPGGLRKEKESAEQQAAEVKDDDCRCKQTAEMTPRELLKLMISDLRFWKKEKT